MFVRLADEWFSFFPAGALASFHADLGLTYAQAGLILAALPAGGVIGNALTVAADFVDRRLLACIGAFVYGLCMLAFAFGDAFALLLVAAFVWGAASDAFVHGSEVALVDLYRDDLAPVLGRVNAYGAVGDLLGPLTLTLAAAVGTGWRGAFAFGGGLMLLYAVWTALLRFPRPRPKVVGKTPIASVVAVARDGRILVLGLVSGLFGLLDEPFLGFTIAYLENVRDLPTTHATTIVTVEVAAGVVGFLVVPGFTARFARRTLLVALATSLAVAVGLLVAAPVVVLLVFAAFTFGFGGAVFWSVLQVTYLSLRPGEAGTSQAVVSTIGLLGVGFPSLVGAVSDAFGLMAGLGLYGAVPLVILLLLWLGNAAPATDR